MAKNNKENIVKNRQIELLKKYYEIDEVNKVIEIKLNYAKASDLLTNGSFHDELYEFKYEVLEHIYDLINRVPFGYKINLKFNVSDYEDCDPTKLLESFNDAIEIRHYFSLNEGKRKYIKVALLLIAGIVALVLKIIGDNSWWNIDIASSQLISEIVDIIGWVFIWEAVSIMFLSPSKERSFILKFRSEIKTVSFLNGDNVLTSEECESVFKEWAMENKIKKISHNTFLISGSAFIGIGIISSIWGLTSCFNNDQYSLMIIILDVVLTLLLSVALLFAGFGAISRYLGYGPFQKFANYFVLISLLIAVCNIILSLLKIDIAINWKMFTYGTASLFFCLLYGIGYVLNLKK